MYSTCSKSSSNLLDGLYACINAPVPRFESRYKFIRDTKSLDEQLFIDDFSKLPLYVTSFSDDPDEQLDSLNLLFTECLERHAPPRKVKVTRPPAPWMETPHIEVAEHLANPLTHIINNCIKRSYFPTKWKMARVSPIPKVVNPTSMNELRPISILPVLSKVFEKAVEIQML